MRPDVALSLPCWLSKLRKIMKESASVKTHKTKNVGNYPHRIKRIKVYSPLILLLSSLWRFTKQIFILHKNKNTLFIYNALERPKTKSFNGIFWIWSPIILDLNLNIHLCRWCLLFAVNCGFDFGCIQRLYLVMWII